jgi:hypothetical protein
MDSYQPFFCSADRPPHRKARTFFAVFVIYHYIATDLAFSPGSMIPDNWFSSSFANMTDLKISPTGTHYAGSIDLAKHFS